MKYDEFIMKFFNRNEEMEISRNGISLFKRDCTGVWTDYGGCELESTPVLQETFLMMAEGENITWK